MAVDIAAIAQYDSSGSSSVQNTAAAAAARLIVENNNNNNNKRGKIFFYSINCQIDRIDSNNNDSLLLLLLSAYRISCSLQSARLIKGVCCRIGDNNAKEVRVDCKSIANCDFEFNKLSECDSSGELSSKVINREGDDNPFGGRYQVGEVAIGANSGCDLAIYDKCSSTRFIAGMIAGRNSVKENKNGNSEPIVEEGPPPIVTDVSDRNAEKFFPQERDHRQTHFDTRLVLKDSVTTHSAPRSTQKQKTNEEILKSYKSSGVASIINTGKAAGDVELIMSRDNRVRSTRSCENSPESKGCPTAINTATNTRRVKCKLNAENCLGLRDILLSFNGPVSEEQAWALCYQSAKCFKAALARTPQPQTLGEQLYDVTDLAHVLLHKDGEIHPATVSDPTLGPDTREPFTSEHKMVFSLGLIVFAALDFGLDEEEERRVAPDLEALITSMTQPEDESETEERLQETDDEGIERDSGESEDDPLHQTPDGRAVDPRYIRRSTTRSPAPCSVNTVIQLCTRHLQGTSEQAETHYKAVIRALVAEALELSHFLEKVAADKQGNSAATTGGNNFGGRNLDTLDFNDWARFWVQVIGELRRGVKLKKVECSIGAGVTGSGGGGPGNGVGKRAARGNGRGIEFELTPYEILMDDIRARRYRLRKTPSPSPHLRKDAHAVILDFIRSRPPLKKASERKLPPLKRQSTPRELLMESIKRPPKPLRPASSPMKLTMGDDDALARTPTRRIFADATRDEVDAGNASDLVTTPKSSRRGSTEPTAAPRYQPRRLIIPVDFKLDGEDDDDDGDDDDDDIVTRFQEDESDCWRVTRAEDDSNDDNEDEIVGGEKGRAGESANPWRRTGGLRLTRNEYHRFCDTQLESYDLATQCPTRRVSSRRHTVVGATGAGLGIAAGTLSLPHSRPQSRQQEPQKRGDETVSGKSKERFLDPELPYSVNNSQDELAQEKSSSKDAASLGNMFLDERLSLTLEEIVHIRSVLTKAELESLPVEGRVKEDVEKRRVCFLCLKTRFGILGPWGQRCRLCERTVCGKCYSKMRIPTEHFAHVPVVLLSPSLMLSPASEVDGKDHSSPSHGAVRSLWPRPAGGVGSAPASPATKRRDPALRNTTPTLTPSSVNVSSHQNDEGAACNSLPPSHGSPAAAAQSLDKSRRFYCSSANSSPARTSVSSSRYGAGDLRVAERLRGVAMVVCHDCRILVLQIIKSSRTTRATIRNNVISRLTLNLSPIYV